jgi:glutamine synthetase
MVQKSKFRQIKKACIDQNVNFIKLKTLDLKGESRSVILPVNMFNEDLVGKGVGFDSSSYRFTKAENSDMVLIPDLDSMFIDPFSSQKTAVFMADIYLSDANRTRFNQDSRYVAQKAEKTLKKSKIGTKILLGPEFEFFIFENAKFGIEENGCYYLIENGAEGKNNYYHLDSPEDRYVDFKNEAVSILQNVNIKIKYHHHEVTANQHEIEPFFNTLVNTGDTTVKIKYVLFNLAKKYDLFVTFMPKPFFGKAGSGWHVHQYILKEDKNIFLDKGKYGNFSKLGLSYISGLLLHSSSLAAFTNPSSNSYKRLVRGFEAPVAAIFAKSNRNAAIRIPAYVNVEQTRLEYRAGDASGNPYLSLAAMLMAGIDGIKKNLNPEKFYFGPFDSGLPESKALMKKIRKLPENLNEALNSLEKDCDYLKLNDVFTDQLISDWISLKKVEIEKVNTFPHPMEFEQYFNF